MHHENTLVQPSWKWCKFSYLNIWHNFEIVRVIFNWLSKVTRQLLWFWFWFYYDLRLTEWSNLHVIGLDLVLWHSIENYEQIINKNWLLFPTTSCHCTFACCPTVVFKTLVLITNQAFSGHCIRELVSFVSLQEFWLVIIGTVVMSNQSVCCFVLVMYASLCSVNETGKLICK